MIDLNGKETIEVLISKQGVLWVNVDGECQLRAQRTQRFVVTDEREFYTAIEAAKFLGLSVDVFRNLVNRGDLPEGEVIDGVTKYNKLEIYRIKEELI